MVMAGSSRLAETGHEAISLHLQNFGGCALRFDFAIAQQDNIGLKLQSFFDVVSDRERLDFAVAEPSAHSGQQLVAQRVVDAGEGFVEQHELAAGNGEGAGQADALAFAAGEIARLA